MSCHRRRDALVAWERDDPALWCGHFFLQILSMEGNLLLAVAGPERALKRQIGQQRRARGNGAIHDDRGHHGSVNGALGTILMPSDSAWRPGVLAGDSG